VHQWARERFEKARVGRLATTTSTSRPHLVPVVFALVGDNVWTAVDAKPKSTRELRRLANIESNPRVSMLVDQYEDDWSALWWVRVDGDATVCRSTRRMGASRFPPWRRSTRSTRRRYLRATGS
jgi:PPOX class probable F420-dependent enzyme